MPVVIYESQQGVTKPPCYITSMLWYWSLARINWEGCDRKGIGRKISEDHCLSA